MGQIKRGQCPNSSDCPVLREFRIFRKLTNLLLGQFTEVSFALRNYREKQLILFLLFFTYTHWLGTNLILIISIG